MKKSLPNLLIPGYHKSGTTTLFNELSKHPDICPSIVKEPYYFRPFMNGKPLPPIKEYQKNFILANHEIYLMEGSPTYIYGGKRVAEKIHKTLGNVKIIICLRNPVNHLFSLYKHYLRFMKCDENETFLSFVQKKNDFSKQFYDEHLKGWYKIFGDNVKCVFFEDFINHPNKTLNDLYTWLEIDTIIFDKKELTNVNQGDTYKFKYLHKISLKVFKILNKRIPHSLFILIRKLYFLINGEPINHPLTNEAKDYLHPIFRPHIIELKKLLYLKGYNNLPDWFNI